MGNVISLSSRRHTVDPHGTATPAEKMTLNTLLAQAHAVRHAGHDPEDGMTVVTGEDGLQRWWHRIIMDDVFARGKVCRDSILCVPHVANVLARYARGGYRALVIADRIFAAAESQTVDDVLSAADTAFLVYVFYPENRLRRSFSYRNIASTWGPSLYAAHADRTRTSFGYMMAETFVSLGTIVHNRISAMAQF